VSVWSETLGIPQQCLEAETPARSRCGVEGTEEEIKLGYASVEELDEDLRLS
jgi:hypothetical protein